MSTLELALALISLLGSALIAGSFFAFSTFVMPALGNRPASEAVPAMQEINVVVVRSLFIVVFLGTAASCLAVALVALVNYEGLRSTLMVAAATCYLIGTFGITIAFNVPLNNSLAEVTSGDAKLEMAWDDYLRRWTRWNHVRTLFSALACVLFAAAGYIAVVAG